jgi:hypothetical protein
MNEKESLPPRVIREAKEVKKESPFIVYERRLFIKM